MEDLISVIIPVYNVEPYLDRCMTSILNQSYRNLEIILIDDKSKDRSCEMCLAYAKKDPRVVVVHGQNEGLSGARNSGLDAAHGKYAVFVDSDDYLGIDMIRNLYDCMLANKADTVIAGLSRNVCGKVIVMENKYAGKLFHGKQEIVDNVLIKMLGQMGDDNIEMSVWKTMFTMEIIQKYHLRFPDTRYMCEDIIFNFEYYPKSQCLAMSDDTSYVYCLNDGSLSQAYREDKIERVKFQASAMRNLTETVRFSNADEAELRISSFIIGNVIHHMKTMAANSGVSRKECLRAYQEISNDDAVRSIDWKDMELCIHGHDRIAFHLLRDGRIKGLYFYFMMLTRIRKLIRGM